MSYLSDIQLDVFRFWEGATQLLPAFAHEALRLFPTHEKEAQAAHHTDSNSNEESFHYTVHVSSSFFFRALECDMSSTVAWDMSFLIV